MGTSYSPKHFVRQTPNHLIEQYLQSLNICPEVEIEIKNDDGERQEKKIQISELGETHVDPILELIESLEPLVQARIERDFRDMDERACKAGIRCLIEESRWEGHHLDIADELEKMGNHYERAMWVFLNHKKVFDNSGNFQKMDNMTFRKASAWKGLVPFQFDDELEDFKQKMIEYYKPEGRGKHCKIEVLKRSCPDRYCYFVYLEDYGDILNEFEGDELKHKPIKPAFEVIFAYHPDSGRIETNAKGKKDQIQALHEAFCQGVLNMEKLPDNDSNMYKLEKLKTRFDFTPRDPQDNISSVKLKYLELGVGYKRRISYTDSGNDSDIYNLIEDSLKTENIPLETVIVTRVKICITFRKMADEKKSKTVTFEIGTPDRCTLKDSPLHLIAQKYVEKWELISKETIEPVEDNTEINEPVEVA